MGGRWVRLSGVPARIRVGALVVGVVLALPTATVTAHATGNAVVVASTRAGNHATAVGAATWHSATGAMIRVVHGSIQAWR